MVYIVNCLINARRTLVTDIRKDSQATPSVTINEFIRYVAESLSDIQILKTYFTQEPASNF